MQLSIAVGHKDLDLIHIQYKAIREMFVPKGLICSVSMNCLPQNVPMERNNLRLIKLPTKCSYGTA